MNTYASAGDNSLTLHMNFNAELMVSSIALVTRHRHFQETQRMDRVTSSEDKEDVWKRRPGIAVSSQS